MRCVQVPRRAIVVENFRLPDYLKHDPEKWTPVFGKDHAQK
jgi:hypothetical protein